MGLAIKLKDRRFLLASLMLMVLGKFLFAGLTPFSGDFLGWVLSGTEVLHGRTFLGVYTAPAYIYGATYFLWLITTKDTITFSRIYWLYYVQSSRIFPFAADIFAFTLFMRIPLLIADVSTLLVLMHIVKRITNSAMKSLTAALLWASSPLVFLAEMATTVEIFPAFLVLAGVYSIYRSKIKVGASLLALGSILRLAPLLFMWIYVVAFARVRQFKNLRSFLGIILAFVAIGLLYVIYSAGTRAVLQLVGARPGILVDEILSSLGLFVLPGIGYNPYGLGLNIIAYLLIAYFLTKPTYWNGRKIGVEGLACFAAFFSLTSYFPHFILWMLPLFVVYAVTTRFGSTRFVLSTLLGFLVMTVIESKYFSAYQKALFLVPNFNTTMASASSTLFALDSLGLVPSVIRSLFSASLLLLIFWFLKER